MTDWLAFAAHVAPLLPIMASAWLLGLLLSPTDHVQSDSVSGVQQHGD